MSIKKFISLIALFAFFSCTKDNKKLFEEFTDIKIPDSINIMKNEYQDMGQDYEKILEVRFDSSSKKSLQFAIFKSQFYNSLIFIDSNIVNESQLITVRNTKGLWAKSKTGYSFYGFTIDKRDNVFVMVDTIKMTAKFQYLSD